MEAEGVSPLCIDLFCGLFGWSAGFVAEGWRCVGFDIAKMGPVPEGCTLVLQDVLTIHGSQFKDAACIVASSPCQEFSYRHMPWKKAKALPPPDKGVELFAQAFRIQREACEAAGRFIPLIAENVVGAQRWVGRAAWHFGSYYLWGDVPPLMPIQSGRKNNGGSWFAVAHNTGSGHSRNPVNDPGRYSGAKSSRENGGWFNDYKTDHCVGISRTGSKSPARKHASAMAAKIPFELARHIAATFYPRQTLEQVRRRADAARENQTV